MFQVYQKVTGLLRHNYTDTQRSQNYINIDKNESEQTSAKEKVKDAAILTDDALNLSSRYWNMHKNMTYIICSMKSALKV